MGTLQRGGESIAFEVRGEGPGLVLLAHNLLADRTSWDAVATDLARAGRRAVLVDLRGHGESTARAPFAVADLARDLLAVLDALGAARADLAGVSLGASAAAEAALLAPDRVRSVALLAASAAASSPLDRLRNGGLAASVAWLGWTGPALGAAVEALLSPGFRAADPAVARGLRARIARLDPGAGARAVRAWVDRPALTGRLAALRAPALVVAGGDDAVAPPALARALAAEVPGARVEVVPGAGHTLPLERPREVAALLAAHLAGLPSP